MLFLGHIGLTAFALSLIYLPALAGIFGALLPDIVDKGFFVFGYAPCSRFLAHTIFFAPVIGLIAYGITRNKKIALAIALGAFLHLLEDMHDNVPFLFPLKDYAFLHSCSPISVTSSPYIIITEIVGGALIIFVFVFNKQFINLRKTLWKFIMGLK